MSLERLASLVHERNRVSEEIAAIIGRPAARAPTELAEYVIIHEAVHLTHFHHQKGFHHKLEQIIPDHRHHEQQLQQYLAAPTNIENKADPLNTKQETKKKS